MEYKKILELIQEMEDFIFQSWKGGSTRSPTVAFARGGDYGKTKNDDLVRKGSGRGN